MILNLFSSFSQSISLFIKYFIRLFFHDKYFIKYNIYNVDYIQKSISVQSLFKIGDTVSILYDSENPNKFVIAQPKWIRIVVGSFITLLALILLIVTWWYYIRK